MLIREFDPWSGELCTCPKKYSFNPYTGCSHRCIYCYITSYIPNAFNLRLKKGVVKKISEEVKKLDEKKYVSMSNSSDPYPLEEKKYEITRKILKIFRENQIKLLIITKSDLVGRDVDILSKMHSSVSVTITTLKDEIAKILEPNAPSPNKRIKALKKLSDNGIKCSVRLDPIIPGLNDGEIEKIIGKVAKYCEHIVSSTIKPRKDGLKRMIRAFPKIVNGLSFEKMGNSHYLPRDLRYSLMKRVRDACDENDLTFATCREGFTKLHNAICDGSHLIS